MSEEIWFGIGALALGVGAIVIAFMGGASNNRAAAKTAIHTVVALVAAIAYVLLATDLGGFDADGDGVAFQYVRYIDWAITTPLLLVALIVTAAPLGRNLWALALAVVFADVAMIATGCLAAAGPTTVTYAWFLVATACFLVVLCLMWGPVRTVSEDGHPIRAEHYRRHLMILTVLWALYPLAFLFGPPGAEVYGPVTLTALFTILDIAAKAGYGILVTLEDHRLAAAENADRRTLAAPPEPAPVPDPESEAAEALRERTPEPVAQSASAGQPHGAPPPAAGSDERAMPAVPVHAPGAERIDAPPGRPMYPGHPPAPGRPGAPAAGPGGAPRGWRPRASDMVPAAIVTSVLVMISRPRRRR